MEYIDKSQIVKKEIISESMLLDVVRNAFDQKFEAFGRGGTVELYRIGRLPSGFHIALRLFRTDIEEGQRNLETQMRLMELYCQNAEHLYSRNEPVPDFCVGVIKGNKAGILTEDLSAGGTTEVEHNQDNNYALVGAERRKVFVDIDGLFRFIPGLEHKYFLDDTVIKL